MSSKDPLCDPAIAIQAIDNKIVLSVRSKTAQLTVLRRLPSVFDFFNLDEGKYLGELNITWWRELGCWSTTKGFLGQVIVGVRNSFIPARVPDLKKALRECRRARPLDDI